MARRQLGNPAQVMQQAPHMIDVIVHAKAPLHEFGHARTSPQVGVKTSGLCTFEQQRFEPTFVLGRQFRWPSWRRLGSHSSLTATSRCRLPPPNAAAIYSNAP